MENAFLTVFNSSVSSCWMILAVILLRFLLINKVPKWSFCVLWGLVALRLACPISLESALSLIPSAQTVDPQILYSAAPEIHSGISRVDSALNPVIQETLSPVTYSGANPVQTAVFSASVVWLGGLSVLLVYGIVSYFAVRRRIAEATRLQGNILECAAVSSPFVLGFLRPRIYLPLGMDPQEADCVIAHERAHIRRGDHWTKPLGFLLLAVHWFNPLAWLAYLLFCRDLELACDERVIRTMDRKQRQTYALTLLACGVDKKRIAACPLAFGETNIKERIKSVVNYKKPTFWILLTSLLCCAVITVCFLTNPKSSPAVCSGFTQPVFTENGSSVEGISVTLEATEIKNGKPLLTVRWTNASSTDFGIGLDLQLYRYENGAPVNCCVNPGRFTEAIARLLPAGESLVMSYDCSDFDLSQAGNYRFESEDGRLWFHFSLPDTQSFSQGQLIPTGRTESALATFADQIENMDTMTISSAMHLPVFRLESTAELQSFMQKNDLLLASSQGSGDTRSFLEAAAQYDDAFFSRRSLALVYLFEEESAACPRVLRAESINNVLEISILIDGTQSDRAATACQLYVIPVEKSMLSGRKLDAWCVFEHGADAVSLPPDTPSLLPPG